MKRTRGQALIEFALVSPILLLLIMGIFDFSRLFITFAVTSNSLRSALRLAEVRGVNASPEYTNCAAMRTRANSVLFADAPTITITYYPASLASSYTCATGDSYLTSYTPVNGDILRINVRATVRMITPLISNMWPSITMQFQGQRTIVSQIQLASLATIATDSDFDGLTDAWEILHFGSIGAENGTNDWDNDHCSNGCEEARGTDPKDPDTDDDGTLDGDELACGTDPRNGTPPDADGDGIDANIECALHLDDSIADFDGDGLTDGQEHNVYHSNPNDTDSDDDGVNDYAEVMTYHTNPVAVDSDMDGLWDAQEIARTTDPLDYDTDNDGLFDGEEVGFTASGGFAGWGTDPKNIDSDGDGLGDGWEVLYPEGTDTDARTRDADDTNPADADSDDDGLDDGRERLILHTDPNLADTDRDNIRDDQEVAGTYVSQAPACRGVTLPPSDPLLPDTDHDGIQDDVDCTNAYDTDGDGLMDAWELTWFGRLDLYDGDDDPDGSDPDGAGPLPAVPMPDGCNNECEEMNGLNPLHPDSDGDTLLDGREVLPAYPGYTGTNPKLADTDGDGVKDGDELANGINPLDSDSDDDGLTDGQELFVLNVYNGIGTNPNSRDSDGDGLTDFEEVTFNDSDPMTQDADDTDPKDSDSDNDGLNDGNERFWDTDPHDTDTDDDTLLDSGELMNGDTDPRIMDSNDTDPTLWDTDGDGLSDGEEYNTYSTDPRDADYDNDGLTDGEEAYFGSRAPYDNYQVTAILTGGPTATGTTTRVTTALNPRSGDSDGDGALDGDEVLILHTDPTVIDSDGDGLDDADEGANGTQPLDFDTDNDRWSDNEELQFGMRGYTYTVGTVTTTVTNNLDPLDPDTDGDGLDDWYETHMPANNYRVVVNGVTPGTLISGNLNPTGWDTDNDGLNDGPEVNTHHTNPLSKNTDNDTIEDGVEVNFAQAAYNNNFIVTINGTTSLPITALSPILDDTDGDGLTDKDEWRVGGTHPGIADTDNDGIADNTDTYGLNQPVIALTCSDPTNCTRAEVASLGMNANRFITFNIAASYVSTGQTVQVNYGTSQGTATESTSTICGSVTSTGDYLDVTGSITFNANGSQVFPVRICLQNNSDSSNETFAFTMAATGSNASKILVSGPASRTGNITNTSYTDSDGDGLSNTDDAYDDNKPTLVLSCVNCTRAELADTGNAPENFITFRITSNYVTDGQDVQANYLTSAGSATELNAGACTTGATDPGDYLRTEGSWTAPPGGPNTTNIDVRVCRQVNSEGNENFTLVLTSTSATGTVITRSGSPQTGIITNVND